MLTHLLAPALPQGSLAGRLRRRPERPDASDCPLEHLQTLDTELARRAGEAGRLRFEMGRGFDLLEQSGGHHALGFSSIAAYALERCERSASWTQKARRLARRLEGLPALAEALISGSLSWSMAAVLATVASRDDADFWLAEASRRTVREMKALVLERRGSAGEADALEAEAELRTLTLTVPREDAWCFEQAKLLGRPVKRIRCRPRELNPSWIPEKNVGVSRRLPDWRVRPRRSITHQLMRAVRMSTASLGTLREQLQRDVGQRSALERGDQPHIAIGW